MTASTISRRARAALAFTTIALAAGACSRGEGAAAADSTPSRVQVGPENVAVVRLESVQVGPTIQGTLEPEQSAAVRAQLGGSVLSTHAEAGQRVAAGALLARLDDAAVRSQHISAQSAVSTAQNAHEIARREVERAQALVSAGAVAERQLEQARNAASAAATQLATARAQLAAVREQLDRTRITAPMAGVVAQRAVNAGDVVTPGMPLFTVVNPASMRLVASVPAEQLRDVRVGIPVSFTVNGYPGRRFTGRVTRVNPTVDPATRQVQVTISIPNAGNTLVGGLFAQGRAASESRTAPVVPVRAIDERGGSPAIVRVKGGVVQRVNVQVGLRDEDLGIAEVTGAVAVGDTVLLGPAMGLSNGTPVQVTQVGDQRPATSDQRPASGGTTSSRP